MHTLAVVLDAPERIALSEVALTPPTLNDVVVDVEWTGISTGTEKLLWSGAMPPFPGMGYPLVPGYESVGRIVETGPDANHRRGERVFVGGARCYDQVHALFGGASRRLVVPAEKAIAIDETLGERGVLIALAATAHHALTLPETQLPDLIVGHGVLGRLAARLVLALGGNTPTVWENDSARRSGTHAYPVIDSSEDQRRDYKTILDMSGSPAILDTLVARLARHGDIILAGFYESALSFNFPPAFMREAKIRIAAEFQRADIDAVCALIAKGKLSLDGLITHLRDAREAPDAYRTAFGGGTCLKMVLDWRTLQ